MSLRIPFAFCSLVFCINSLFPIDYEGQIVEEIEILSNQIPEQRILAFLTIEEGDPLNAQSIREAFRELYSIGVFRDLKFDLSKLENGNLKLSIIVRELPQIQDVQFFGNRQFADDELIGEFPIRKGDYYTETLVHRAVDYIKDKYREEGYLMTRVNVTQKTNEKTAEIRLIMDIDEGQEMIVGKITFYGVKKLREKSIKKAMETVEDKFLREGVFNDASFEEDKTKIILFYQSKGYKDAKIEKVRLSYRWKNPQKKKTRKVHIEIWIDEGPLYYFGHLLIKGNVLFTKEELYANVQRKLGHPFSEIVHQQDIERITLMYHQRGYIFARVTPVDTIDEQRRIIHHVLDIYEGDKAHIEGIYIEGNEKTKDFVIRREIQIREGEIFDRDKVQRSVERLRNTQYFSSVVPEPRPGSVEGLMNLIFRVKEQRTGLLSGGAGFGTQSGFSLTFKVQEQNFLGRGQSLGADLNLGTIDQIGMISFSEPYLFDKDIFSRINLRLGVERRERNIDNLPVVTIITEINGEPEKVIKTNFSELIIPATGRPGENPTSIPYKNFIATLGLDLGYRFKDWYRISMGVSAGIENPFWGKSTPPWSGNRSERDIWEEYGGSEGGGFFKSDREKEIETGISYENGLPSIIFRFINSISFQIDTRDNRVITTRGLFFDFNLGLVYGSSRYSTWNFQFSYYKTLFWKLVFAGNHQLITLGDLFDAKITRLDESRLLQLRREELRGWAPQDISDHRKALARINREPENFYIDFINPVGRSRILNSYELRFPFFQQFLWGVFFLDMANISSAKFLRFKGADSRFNLGWLLDPRHWMFSVGTGFRIELPQFPIRFYFSWKFYYDREAKKIAWPNFDGGRPEFTFNVLGFF